MNDQTAFSILLIVIHFCVSFAVLYVVYWLFKKAIGWLQEPLAGTGNDKLNLAISLGISLLFFNRVVLDGIIKVGRFFISPFTNLSSFKPLMIDFARSDTPWELFPQFLFDWSVAIERSFSTYILGINFTQIIIFCAFWLLVSLLVRDVRANVSQASKENKGMKIGAGAKNPALKNLLTLLIVSFAIYLSLASIIAVPEFQVLESSGSESDLTTKLSEDLENQRLYTKTRLLISEDTALNKSPSATVNRVIEKLRETTREYNKWVELNWSRDEKAKKIAISRFKAAIEGKIKSRERIAYRLDLSEWYLSYHEPWTFGTSFIQSDLTALQQQIKKITQTKSNFETDSTGTDSTGYKIAIRLNEQAESRLTQYETELWNLPSKLYAINVTMRSIPEKPQIGEGFGIFNVFSGWLLRTESLSLALIVGLFGFGLLGSIGSTFIRKRIKGLADDDDDELILSDLPGVIVNGLSAAIVMFLAVKGAIVVFSTDGSTLNPYTLFFSCLVASVFSEDVWMWARKKLGGITNPKENGVTPTEDDNEADAPNDNATKEDSENDGEETKPDEDDEP